MYHFGQRVEGESNSIISHRFPPPLNPELHFTAEVQPPEDEQEQVDLLDTYVSFALNEVGVDGDTFALPHTTSVDPDEADHFNSIYYVGGKFGNSLRICY